MILQEYRVQNFRSIADETLRCDSLTALVGTNGAGKSSFLKALSFFYEPAPKITPEDFYNKDVSSPIVVSVTFKDLNAEATALFSNYIQNGTLTVEKIASWENGRLLIKYHGATLQNPDFVAIRQAASAGDKKSAYAALRTQPSYSGLANWTNQATALESLKNWEEANPLTCVRTRDDGQFFGFAEVAQGYLGKYTRFLFIPAIKDASAEALDNRGSIITTLMDLVVRSVIANREAVKALKATTQQKYEEVMNPDALPELKDLERTMTETLKIFAPETSISMQWTPLEEINLPMPKADVKLVEDGYLSPVSCTGHGLQRAFILTLLQHLACAKTEAPVTTDGSASPVSLPNFILAIEEPELYQHPSRQRYLAKILAQLSTGITPGVADHTQILYCTHSPLFVGIDRLDQVRVIRKKCNGTGNPKISQVISTSLDMVAEKLWENEDPRPDEKFTGATLLPRLKAIMTPWMNEGFFADVVVLVEGEDDRAALLGVANAKEVDFEGNGISVIPCGGKTNLDRPYVIFSQLGIPIYAIWDGDSGRGETRGNCPACGRALDSRPDPRDNRKLLRLLGEDETDWPSNVAENFACFPVDLETTLRAQIGGDIFDECLNECQLEWDIKKRKIAIKNPNVIQSLICKAHAHGHTCVDIENIIGRISALKNGLRLIVG